MSYKQGYYESPLGSSNADWFVGEPRDLDKNLNFFFKRTQEGVIMTDEKEKNRVNKNTRKFCEKKKIVIRLELIAS